MTQAMMNHYANELTDKILEGDGALQAFLQLRHGKSALPTIKFRRVDPLDIYVEPKSD